MLQNKIAMYIRCTYNAVDLQDSRSAALFLFRLQLLCCFIGPICYYDNITIVTRRSGT